MENAKKMTLQEKLGCKIKIVDEKLNVESLGIEDTLKNDTLSKLHILIGKNVYSYSYIYERVLQYSVDYLTIGADDKTEKWHTFEATATVDAKYNEEIEFSSDDIGKTVFFTRKEAEARLKELQSNVKQKTDN